MFEGGLPGGQARSVGEDEVTVARERTSVPRWRLEGTAERKKKKMGVEGGGMSRVSSRCVECEARECYLAGWVDGFIKN